MSIELPFEIAKKFATGREKVYCVVEGTDGLAPIELYHAINQVIYSKDIYPNGGTSYWTSGNGFGNPIEMLYVSETCLKKILELPEITAIRAATKKEIAAVYLGNVEGTVRDALHKADLATIPARVACAKAFARLLGVGF